MSLLFDVNSQCAQAESMTKAQPSGMQSVSDWNMARISHWLIESPLRLVCPRICGIDLNLQVLEQQITQLGHVLHVLLVAQARKVKFL